MKKVLILIILIFMLFINACTRVEKFIFGDFIYLVVQINDEGKIISSDSKNKKCVDKYINIIGLTDEGKTKEIIIIPRYIENIEVRQVGDKPFEGKGESWENENLKRVYIPFQTKVYDFPKMNDNVKVVELSDEYIGKGTSNMYITSFKRNPLEEHFGFAGGGIWFANVSYMFNYEDSPNDGYYWIDDYDYGTNITYIPNNPTRDGYIFDGWYKEAECINKWDFDVDKLPEALYDDWNRVLYQETILYAKWIDESIKNREESQAKIELAYSRYVLDRVFTDYGYYNIYKDNYAGMYLDEKGLLSVELVEGMNNEEDIEFLTENNISYSLKKFSYNYMQNIMISVNDIAVEAGLVSVGIEEKENHVLIEMNKVDKVDCVIDYLKEQGLYDSEAVVIYADENLQIVLD
ncbi:MAG: InlB B-repeat-containing protein [Bacilli bacterium]|nr:InlB B-repeat-containing protein [Bacilli bacterium]